MVKLEDIAVSVPEMATLLPEQEKQIEEFLQMVDEEYKSKDVPFLISRESTPERRRIFAYKLLTARKWKTKHALGMLHKTVAFRAEHGMDEWKLFPCAFPLRGYDEEAICGMLEATPGCDRLCHRNVGDTDIDGCYRALQASYVNVYHYWDKEGHPVLYDCCGHANVGQILKDLGKLTGNGKSLSDVIVPYHTYMNEVQYYLIQYADRRSKQSEKRAIMGITVVMDMEGLSFKVVRRSFIQIIRAIFAVDQAYYPEVLHRLFIINAPSFFRIAYDFVKGSLDENTRRKLVFSSDKAEALKILKQVIDEDKIPSELGGGCHCEGGCLPRYEESESAAFRSPASSQSLDNDVETEQVHLRAGKEWTRSYPISCEEEVTWEVNVEGGSDVRFMATFERSKETDLNHSQCSTTNEATISSKKGASKRKHSVDVVTQSVTLKDEKLDRDLDTYKATSDGVLVLTLSNKHSWMHGKQVELRLNRSRPIE